jgi:sugar lactone lactonase YvrE
VTRSRLLLWSIAAALAVAAAATAHAVSPKYWIHDTAEDFLRGETDGVSITGEGSLRLAPPTEVLAEREEPYIWDFARDPRDGRVYLGTGDEGWIVRVDGSRAESFFRCDALEVVAVAVDGNGRVFAGTAPEGFVYSIGPDGEGRVLFDAPEPYVWDLAFGPGGQLFAAVGPGGAVYRVDPASGEAEKIFRTDDNHVVCLAFDSEGNLLLGTEGRGLVVRVAKDGAARVLYDCPEGEVGAVIAGPDGGVWAAAAATAEAREEAGDKMTRPDSNADGTGVEYLFEVTPSEAGDGVLYRIDADGNASRAWESGQGAIYDLAWAADGKLLATTGDEGRVYEIDGAGRATLLVESGESQVVAIAPEDDRGWLYATANPSRLVRMSAGHRKEGTLVSEVLDARHLSTWGRIEWAGDENGGEVTLAVRAGNTDEPDASWSGWSEEVGGDHGELGLDGTARYLQWRVTLAGGGKETPLVRRVRVSSLENNLPPLISAVTIVPAGNKYYEDVPELRPRPIYQSLPGGVKVQYSFDAGGEQELPPEARAPWTQGLRQVSWEAADPNEDQLVFDLSYRREDESRWKVFAEDVADDHFTFNAKGMPDGEYRILVTASDRGPNPNDEKTAQRESEPFLVDNTAPGFRDLEHERTNGELRISGVLADELSDVVRFEVSMDGEEWRDRPPADGIFDSPGERFDVKLPAEAGAEHSIILRGTDLAGNLGTTRVLIRP